MQNVGKLTVIGWQQRAWCLLPEGSSMCRDGFCHLCEYWHRVLPVCRQQLIEMCPFGCRCPGMWCQKCWVRLSLIFSIGCKRQKYIKEKNKRSKKPNKPNPVGLSAPKAAMCCS